MEIPRNLVHGIVLSAMFLMLPGPLHAQFTTNNFYNWETAPVHPVALSPDGTRLVVCNLPNDRLDIFDVTSGVPVLAGNIPVGLDPVTVRFRTDTELWVANYISGSISVVDLPSLRVVNTLSTTNQPSDIVFAGTPQLAYVSCGLPNMVQVFDPATELLVTNLVLDGNVPRAMDVSPDGSKVYVAIFESGNASTIIGTGISQGAPRANPVDFPFAPSLGLNPPPNSGTNFVPAINPLLTNPPPQVGLIVKKNSASRWMDDNNGDWTEFIRGTNAAFTGRVPGWDMPDHDLAVIDTTTFGVTYACGLMNICMAVGVNPASGKIWVVGTDAINNIRFQPVLDGIFIRVNLAQVDPLTLTNTVSDLNPQLTYQAPLVSQTIRDEAIGDPRGIVWSADGSRGYVTGMGSDNLIIIDAQGNRAGLVPTINVGQGPTGMALDESRNRLYIYNRFDASLSTVDTIAEAVTNTLSLLDPTPAVIKAGRPHIYNTQQTSGLGQLSCASCHVDTRSDRLAWDLGVPTDPMAVISNANFGSNIPAFTNNYHPMKGPMTTITLQDIIGHEPFHWRGDREGIEQFNVTFTNLQGAPEGLTTNEMADMKSFLATVRFPPNPYREFDNSLATNLPLPGQFVLGRGALPAGAPLPNGNPQNGQLLFRQITNATTSCTLCHTLPTGLGTDLHFTGNSWVQVPLGTNFAHHISLIELERSNELPFKIPQLRNLFDKLGMDLMHTNSRAGFGLTHDGSVDSPVRFVQDAFGFTDDQQTADLVAFLFSITGSGLIPGSSLDPNHSPGVASLDTPAAVGRQITINNPTPQLLISNMIALADASPPTVDLIVKGIENGEPRGWFYDRTNELFQSDRLAETETPAALLALAAVGSEQTYTVVPLGSGWRLGIDEDAGGYLDGDALDNGVDPDNPLSLAANVPVFEGVTNQMALDGQLLSLAINTTGPNIPGQVYTFSLTNSPSTAAINPTNGIFSWVPNDPPGTFVHSVTVVVTDNGNPPQSAAATFSITVSDLSASPPVVSTNGIVISWHAIPGLTYQIQYKNNLTDPAWTDLPGDIQATNTVALKLDSPAGTNVSRFYRIIALP
jgi:DNA-binding beta-propeller fold protein YncE